MSDAIDKLGEIAKCQTDHAEATGGPRKKSPVQKVLTALQVWFLSEHILCTCTHHLGDKR